MGGMLEMIRQVARHSLRAGQHIVAMQTATALTLQGFHSHRSVADLNVDLQAAHKRRILVTSAESN